MRIEKKKIEKIEREEEVGRYDEENGNWLFRSSLALKKAQEGDDDEEASVDGCAVVFRTERQTARKWRGGLVPSNL